MDRILITGGAGFIGSSIFKKFNNTKNSEVFVIDNLSFGNKKFIQIKDENFFNIDIRDREAIFETINIIKPNIVIHLAAIHFIPYCNKFPFESSDINIRGTINILDAIEGMESLKKVFFASTAAVYPIVDRPISELNELVPLDIYGLSKLTGEKLFEKFHNATSIPTIICRFFNAFGPNETNPHLIPEIQIQVNEGKRKINLGNLTPKRDFIHTSDMANAVFGLIEKFGAGLEIFNLGSGKEYSVIEIVKAFEIGLNEKIEINIDESRVRKVERMHLVADIKKLKEFLDWEPKIEINEGIKSLLNENIIYNITV